MDRVRKCAGSVVARARKTNIASSHFHMDPSTISLDLCSYLGGSIKSRRNKKGSVLGKEKKRVEKKEGC